MFPGRETPRGVWCQAHFLVFSHTKMLPMLIIYYVSRSDESEVLGYVACDGDATYEFDSFSVLQKL